jgi:two-component system NarL family sensor kinase
VLDEAGLEAALRAIARRAANRAGFELRLDFRYPRRHPREQLLFSAARELLANVVAHARASEVLVRLAEVDGDVLLLVEDDGVGLPPEGLSERLASGHIGLASQRVRVEAAGGTLEVEPAHGGGTRVEVRIPWAG